MRLDLNCDLGEGESPRRTLELMRWITSANIACGGHAGDVKTMERCVGLARKFKVRLGAHPGIADRGSFGRAPAAIQLDELEGLLLCQVGSLDMIARRHGLKLHHIKLHGALYHAAEGDETLGVCYLQSVARYWPRAKVYVRAGGKLVSLARRFRVAAWPEIFADRAYTDDGRLLPRHQPGAVLDQLDSVTSRLASYLASGCVRSTAGRALFLDAKTICLHADTANAVRLARALAEALDRFAPPAC